MSRKRLLATVSVSVLVAASFAGTSASASTGATANPNGSKATGTARAITGDRIAWRPPAGDPNRIIRVIVEVAGDSVAAAEGNAVDAGTAFTSADSAKVAAAATATQNAVIKTVTADGGKVGRRHVNAINAMTVSIKAGSVGSLEADPNVVAVTPLAVYQRDNGNSNVFTGVTSAWQNYGATGTGETIAIIDTGVDYDHADFGGSGIVADFTNNDPTVIEPNSFPTAKVVGGYDFVGDAYDAASTDPAKLIPVPDPDPIGCAAGGEHGTHVAGTAAGDGVTLDGKTYTGPYDASIDPTQFLVSPGSAPQADILAYKVFGCEGSVDSDVLIAAIDQAVSDGADVINMSLGSDLGEAKGPEQTAVDNAVRAGVVVVTSAGNGGHAAYFVGGPSTANRALSVAALDANASFPGATITGGGTALPAINANAAPLGTGVTGTLVVESDASGIKLGCSVADFTIPAGVTNPIFVIQRGVCDRVAKPAYGQAAGGVGVIMVNTATDFPPFEGNIPGVTIPFLGVQSTSAAALVALNGTTVTLTDAGLLANPSYTQPASFSSGGPRSGDSAQKPDVIAPGVGIFSAGLGTGTQGIELSGTSMSSPHTAGIAAIVKQMHPTWSAEMIKAAIVNTAQGSKVGDFDTRIAGNGLVNPQGAIATDTLLTSPGGTTAVNFGFQELNGSYTDVKTITLKNTGKTAATYKLAPVWNSDPLGAVVTVSPSKVTVPARSSQAIQVKIVISKAAAAALPDADLGSDTVTTLRGQIVATPTTNDQVLSLPFMMAPHARSDIEVTKSAVLKVGKQGSKAGTVVLKNYGVHSGNADVYNWLLDDGRDRGLEADSRAVGVQYFPGADPVDHPGEPLMVFAFSEFSRFSSPTQNYYQMSLDTDHDGVADHEIYVIDQGAFETGIASGVMLTYVLDEDFNGFVYGADAATDGSVVLGLAYPSDLGMTAASGPATVIAASFSYTMGTVDPYNGSATINPFNPQASSGDYITMAPKDSASFAVTERAPLPGETPVKGWVVVTLDDPAGTSQSDFVRG